MSVAALQQELSKADVVIRPDIENLSSSSFSQREAAILAEKPQQEKPYLKLKHYWQNKKTQSTLLWVLFG